MSSTRPPPPARSLRRLCRRASQARRAPLPRARRGPHRGAWTASALEASFGELVVDGPRISTVHPRACEDHRKDKERASSFPAAKATVEQLYGIWLEPHRHGKEHPNGGNVVMRMRYIGIFDNGNMVVLVDCDGAGNAVVTRFPRRDIDSKRVGYLLYPR